MAEQMPQHQHWKSLVGSRFAHPDLDTCTLAEVSEARRQGDLESFSLLFESTTPHHLDQGMYTLVDRDGTETPLFLVPVGPHSLEAVLSITRAGDSPSI